MCTVVWSVWGRCVSHCVRRESEARHATQPSRLSSASSPVSPLHRRWGVSFRITYPPACLLALSTQYRFAIPGPRSDAKPLSQARPRVYNTHPMFPPAFLRVPGPAVPIFPSHSTPPCPSVSRAPSPPPTPKSTIRLVIIMRTCRHQVSAPSPSTKSSPFTTQNIRTDGQESGMSAPCVISVAPSHAFPVFPSEVLREPVAEFFGVMILIIFGAGVDCQVVLSANTGVASSPKGVSASDASLSIACSPVGNRTTYLSTSAGRSAPLWAYGSLQASLEATSTLQ